MTDLAGCFYKICSGWFLKCCADSSLKTSLGFPKICWFVSPQLELSTWLLCSRSSAVLSAGWMWHLGHCIPHQAHWPIVGSHL